MKNQFTSYLRYSIYIVLSAFLLSCEGANDLYNGSRSDSFEDYSIVKIDSCEYIMYRASSSYLHVTHKGNCNNTIHNCR